MSGLWRRLVLGNHFLLAGLFFSAVVTLAAILASGDTLRVPDEGDYRSIAKHVAEGKGFTIDGQTPTAYRPPLYPLFLAIVYRMNERPLSGKLAGSLFWGASIVVAYFISRKLFGSSTAMTTAILMAFYLPLMFYNSLLITEVLATLLVGLLFLCLIDYEQSHRLRALAAGGIALGLAGLTRTAFLGLAPIVILWLFVSPKIDRKFSRAILFVICAAVVVAPWSVRNYLTFGQFVAVDTNSGVNFLLGNNPETPLTHSWEANEPGRVKALEAAFADGPQDEAEFQAQAFREGLSFIIHNPGRAIVLFVGKVMDFWEMERIFFGLFVSGSWWLTAPTGWLIVLLIQLSFVATLLLAILGLCLAGPSPARLLVTLIAVGLTIIYSVAFSHSRFNVPLFSILIPFSAYGLMIVKRLHVHWPPFAARPYKLKQLFPFFLCVVFLLITWARQVVLDLHRFV